MWDPYAEFEKEVLPNGLTVYAAHWPDRPWEAMGFLVYAGASLDPEGREGLAHFVEHLVSENTELPKRELIAFFKNSGGEVELGTTGYLSTHYKFLLPIDEKIISRGLSIFSKMLLAGKIQNNIERERQVILSEFYEHYPIQILFDLVLREHQQIFSGFWLERMVRSLGSPESVKKISQEDLQLHYNTHYTPQNISIVGVGRLKIQQLTKLLTLSPFAISKSGKRTPIPQSISLVPAPKEKHYALDLSKYFSTPVQAGSYRSVAAIPGVISYRTIKILRDILNELLLEEIRESRGWAYDIEVDCSHYGCLSEFAINSSGLSLSVLEAIEDLVERSITSLNKREDLFNQAKQRILARNTMIDSTGKGICDGALEDLKIHQRIISLTEFGQEIEQVSMANLREALEWVKPERRWTCILKPQ